MPHLSPRAPLTYLRALLRKQQMTGQVNRVDDKGIRLWIVSPNAGRAVQLRVSLNGLLIDTLDLSASDLPQGDKPSELSIPLRFGRPLRSGDVVTVTAGRSHHLAGSPWYVMASPPDVRYALLHIPKTAGTSLRMAIETALGADHVFPNSVYLRKRGGKYLSGRELRDALAGASPRVRLLQGHLALKEARTLVPEAGLITVLREPVARVESLLKHIRTRHGVAQSYGDMLAAGGAAGIGARNHQTRLLSMLDARAPIAEHFDCATEQLNSFVAVGITERYEDTLKSCGQLFGIDLGEPSHLNVADVRDDPSVTVHRQKIESMNEFDQKLYDVANGMLSKRVGSLNK